MMEQKELTEQQQQRIVESFDKTTIKSINQFHTLLETSTNRYGELISEGAKIRISCQLYLTLYWYYSRYYNPLRITDKPISIGTSIRYGGLRIAREHGRIEINTRNQLVKLSIPELKKFGAAIQPVCNKIANENMKQINHPVRDPNKSMADIMKELRANSIRN